MLLVLIKPVADITSLKISRLTNSITEINPRKISEPDKSVLEFTSKLNDTNALTVCDPEDSKILREAYAKGIKKCTCIRSSSARQFDKLTIAKAIAKYITGNSITQIIGRAGLVTHYLRWLLDFQIVDSFEPSQTNVILTIRTNQIEYKRPSAIAIAKSVQNQIDIVDFNSLNVEPVNPLLTVSQSLL
ncbi:MAG: hypothetical protein HY606_07670 [Planctomycetes bacterium]|nr:hypothetical protein [Planctomycetota bacterium]